MSKSFYVFFLSLLVFLAALHPAKSGPNDPVNIPDTNLRAAIETALGKSAGATITEAEMQTIPYLTSLSSDISDLTGLEHATNLTGINMLPVDPGVAANARPHFNLDPIANLANLEELWFQYFKISDLTPVANLTTLKLLSISETYGGLTQIPNLSKLTALVHLRVNYNAITDITGVSGLTNLRSLTIHSNPKLSDISPLTQLRNLEILELDSTSITRQSLSAVLPFLSTEIDQEFLEQYPSYAIRSGVLGIGNTNISDLSVLDSLPNVFLWDLKLNFMGTGSNLFFLLTDLTPLVDLMNKKKVINSRTGIRLAWNLGLDYASIYEDLPVLVSGSRRVLYTPSVPMLERAFPEEASYRGHPRTRYTFTVRGINKHPSVPESWFRWTPRLTRDRGANSQFAKVPVRWTVTAPDGSSETMDPVETGDDGLARVQITLGNDGETHIVEAVVPAKTTSVTNIEHPELRVSFTVTADRTVPPPARPSPPPRTSGIRGPNRTPDRLAFRGQIGFSELMFDTGGEPDALPQWIELCNVSQTETVNLWDWNLETEVRDAAGQHRHAVVRLNNLQILPNETALIVTSDAPNSINLLEGSVYNFFEHHPRAFKDNKTRQEIPGANSVLGQPGFYLRLSHPTDGVSDVVGNLDGNRWTQDEPAWMLPAGITDAGVRTSLLRLYDDRVPLDGKVSENYVRAADVGLEVTSYYGKATDVGNPGYKKGWTFPLGPPGGLYFSELMLTSKGGLHSLPQWIELYNDLETEVDLRDYQLKIETLDAAGERRHAVIKLNSFLIPPRQTAVLVSGIAGSSRDVSRRVYSLVSHHRDMFTPKSHRDRNKAFGQTGFFLKLSDPDGIVIDIAGNLDGIEGTVDAPRWELPAAASDVRASLMRRYYRATGIPLDGKKEENWIPASEMTLEVMSYYGHSTDIGNPGYINDARRMRSAGVSFSELMFTQSRGRRSLPGWIEVYNGFQRTVDLRGYQLEIEARDALGEHRHDIITFQRLSIPAHQAAVLVMSPGRHSSNLPRDRLYILYRRLPAAFRHAPNQILGEGGFFLKLSDPEGRVSDVVGNLDGNKHTKDPLVWELPAGKIDAGARTSLMRRYHEIGMPLDGRVSENWVPASEMRLEVESYYGKETDIGNPGYTNQAQRLPGHQVSFSELMLTSRGGLHSLPQWIELYNDSETEVDLRGYQLHIEARDAAGAHRYGIIRFKDLRIPGHQTALIVTWSGRRSREIPRERVYHISDQKAFDRNAVLGESGFFLKLLDTEGRVSDIAGNLDGDRRTEDAPAWQLATGKTQAGHRTSLMRRYYHVTGIPLDGRISENWVPALKLPLQVMTYWGKETDIGNPGHRGGGPLPVGLSRFHPVRDKATGHVEITWVTESELNNAGFNILRSETKLGRFKVINVKGLIAGHGTTNEKHLYTFTDTTAKPNVVYYYRLEEVSLAGQHTPLATTHVRGHVIAAGKLTMMWSDLKKSR